MISRRALVIAALALLTIGAAVLTYRFRSALMSVVPPSAPAVATTAPSKAASDAPIPASADTLRGDVSIDARRQQLIGVRTASVRFSNVAPTIRTTGTVRYDETRQVDVNVKVDGWIRDLYVDYTGQPVRRGERLFTLYSPDLLATENEFILALENRDGLQPSQVADARDYAGRLVDAARQRLTLWDVTADDIATIERTRQPVPAVTVSAPADGFVVEKAAVRGVHVSAGQTLYKIADLTRVWVDADVYEQEVPFLRVGDRATVRLDAYPQQAFAARAIYVYPFVENQSRIVKVRFDLANPEGRLRPGMFANVELHGAEHRALTVPTDAVLDSGTEQLVFVTEGNGTFSPRHVKVGARLPDQIEIVDGLKEGEQVATSATFFLDSESQLRAGTENYEPPAAAGGSTGGAASPPLTITFRPQQDPPQTGDNTFEVHVADPNGAPVNDATVSVQLFMPAMPTMNMPAMRNSTTLSAVGGGVYRGTGQVMMGGRWEVTVSVTRDGRPAGSHQFALVTR